jgi:NAD-dependent SIR2 family protein deacetylase
MRQFVDIVARRWDTAPSSRLVQDSIISTNYDVLIEQALTQGEMEADYALPDHRPSTKAKAVVKLLKLHGSANWSICTECSHVKVHPPGTQIATVEAGPCENNCGAKVEPFIVPPTWSKGERRAALESVWKAAFDELLDARRWVFIGSSLPETDKFLRYLFGLALQPNPKLDRIVIIDPNPCGYDDLFQTHASKISFEHLARTGFQDAIQQPSLQRALGQVPYRQGNPLW